MSPTTQKRQLWRFLIGFFFQTIPGAMLAPMLALSLAARGVEAALIGGLASAASLAYMLALLAAPALIRRVGERATFRLSLAIGGLAIGGLALSMWPPLWAALYAALGFAAGLRYTMAESWVPALAPADGRGRALALFQTGIGAASFVGAGALLLTGVEGPLPRALACAAALAGAALLWPMEAPAAGQQPAQARLPRAGARAMIARVGPLVLGAALLGGLFEAGLSIALPLYGLTLGLSPALAAGLATAIGLGSLAQYPFGALADRLPWERVVLGCAALIAASALLLPLAQLWPWLLLALGIVWGGVGGGLYTLASIRNGERWRGAALVSASVLTQFAYMVGEAVGPTLGGLALDLAPRYGLPVLVGGLGMAGLAALVGAARGAPAAAAEPA